MKALIALVLAAVVAATVGAAAAVPVAPIGAAVPAAAGPSLSQLPQRWQDERAQGFDLGALRGHRVVLTLAYAECHRWCPRSLALMREWQERWRRAGEEAEFVVIGLETGSEGASAWRTYRQTHRVEDPHWHFLIGQPAAVEQSARQLAFRYWQYDQHIVHDAEVFHFDGQGAMTERVSP